MIPMVSIRRVESSISGTDAYNKDNRILLRKGDVFEIIKQRGPKTLIGTEIQGKSVELLAITDHIFKLSTGAI